MRVPNTENQSFKTFIGFLSGNCGVSPAGGLSELSYKNDRKVINVAVKSLPQYGIGECWFNCLEQALNHGGGVIYGWALWEVGKDHYQAQHHAIWHNVGGDLLDVTPNAINSDNVLFMPDGRAPFDPFELRHPFSLDWRPKGAYDWVAMYNKQVVRKRIFHIGRLVPTANELIRIKSIQSRL